ncbi:MAG: hypothetical protein CMK28_04745 [Porticoccaceae bacterium]|nr:hypothetical protein [Porticoccaceae bacterium]
MVRQRKFYFLLVVIFSAVSCSIAGSWAFERIDNYLIRYFNEYASFSAEQQTEIERVAKDYQNWFAKNELPKIKTMLLKMKQIHNENSEELTLQIYDYAVDLFTKTGLFFEIPFIEFSNTLDKEQIIDIEKYFAVNHSGRESEIDEDSGNYSDLILKRYIAGFKKIKMKLTDSQIKTVVEGANAMDDLRLQWLFHRKDWTAGLMALLSEGSDPLYEVKLISHLRQISSLGDSEFRSKLKKNREINIDIIAEIFGEASETQLASFRKRLDVFIASIDRILATRPVEGEVI